ncbi:MAG: AI-2E family transporter [Flavobacteriales bacterium]|nr:AI-2E family transporter [Flavobacteriales bacterium]
MKNKILEAVFILSGIALALYFLFEIRQVLVYLIISTIVAIVGQPVVSALNKINIKGFKIPNSISSIITVFLFLGFISSLGLSLVPLINEQANSLALLKIENIEANVIKGMAHLNDWIVNFGFTRINLDGSKIKELIDFSFVPNFLNSIVGTMGGLTIGILTISFITFFFFKDKDMIKSSIVSILPNRISNHSSNLMSTVKVSLSRYLFGLMIQITILFLLYTLVLYVAGIKNFLIIAMLGALLNLIPYVGPLIGFLLMNLLSITGNITADFQTVILPMITKISIGYVIIQLIDNFLNQPIIFSKTANAHPLEIFLVILIAGNLFGIIGMVVAVPSYTILRIILKEFFSEFKIVKSLTKNL